MRSSRTIVNIEGRVLSSPTLFILTYILMAKTKIDCLLEAVEKLINNPIAPIAPVAPVLPIAPLPPVNNLDHDLLQRLDTKVDALKDDIKAIQTGTSAQIDNHERRLNTLETSKTKQTTLLTV
jgi:hypothetical protein